MRGRPWAPPPPRAPTGLSPQPGLLPRGRSVTVSKLPFRRPSPAESRPSKSHWDRGHRPARAAGTAPLGPLARRCRPGSPPVRPTARGHGGLFLSPPGPQRLRPRCAPLPTLLAGAPGASAAAVQAWLPLKPRRSRSPGRLPAQACLLLPWQRRVGSEATGFSSLLLCLSLPNDFQIINS